MNKSTWMNYIGDIFEFFRYTDFPTDGAIDQWVKKIDFIPEAARPWIVEQITNGKKVPYNLPNEIIRLWTAFRKTHPHMAMPGQDQYCADCYGHGTHYFKKLDRSYSPPMEISYVAACSSCQKKENVFGTVVLQGGRIPQKQENGSWIPVGAVVKKLMCTTKADIIRRGYTYCEQHDPKSNIYKPTKVEYAAIRDRLDKVGGEILAKERAAKRERMRFKENFGE